MSPTSSTFAPSASPVKVEATDAPAGGGSRSLADRARRAVDAAVAALFAKQRTVPIGGRGEPGHHWCGELEGDSILSSEYLLMKFILSQENDDRPRLERITNQLRLAQRPDGSWGQYPGSPPDISACVKAYSVLKLMGDRTDAPHMVRARELILRHGGAEMCNTFSTFYLACLGQVTWGACPAIPPQIVLLPRWFPFHMRKVAAWTRTMILPLALCSALQPVRKLAPEQRIDELFIDPRWRFKLSKRFTKNPFTWNNFFLLVDKGIKACRAVGFRPFHNRAIKRAEQWIVDRMRPETTEGLGAIFPPMVYVQVAFKALGYGRDHPVIRQAEADLDAFMIDEKNADPRLDHIRLQPCFSPVWDTAIALDALGEAGQTAAGDERIARACDWLRQREVLLAGDHIANFRKPDRGLKPGRDIAMWAFEYRNDWYPDVDDTCMVARGFARVGDRPGQTANADACRRAVRWILAMQNDDGGWAAFDRTKIRNWMEAIPFADHNAMQDPSCSDITGRVLESIIVCGIKPDHPAVQRGVKYILRTQQPEGCWWGRWGVNYIYGTWQAVCGLRCAGVPADHPALVKVRDWLLASQNADGGFGESANSYLDRSQMGKGPSTASQTAWALITLMHLMPKGHNSIERDVEWLCNDQLVADKRPFEAARHSAPLPLSPSAPSSSDPVHDLAGGWNEHWFTGTGFPKVFYLRYHLYRHSFPLKALARFARFTTSP